MDKIAGKTMDEWKKAFPIIEKIIATEEVFWANPKYSAYDQAMKQIQFNEKDIRDANERLQRFAPYIAKAFPETTETNGIIESPTVPIPAMQHDLEEMFGQSIPGKLLLKCDNTLPISGSIKARGGIYEVLKYTEELAIKHGKLSTDDDYAVLDSEAFRKFYSNYEIAVASTGNLGLSIGIISAKMGFHVTVHMSADARRWKKDLLREKGATVIEHASDYSKAVEEGRRQAEEASNCYFVDDENSTTLFLGYAVAASRLKQQLDDMDVKVDRQHPLFVYLPCGVGGGPGGVAFGLKTIFKDNVHCFFAEPTHSPCMLLGQITEKHDEIAVQDFGIDNRTAADGLAVGRPSRFVGKTLEGLISGDYTVDDDKLFILLSRLADTEKIWLEPSALAGVYGPVSMLKSEAGQNYLADHGVEAARLANTTHIAWATGGSMVPDEVMADYYRRGVHLKK